MKHKITKLGIAVPLLFLALIFSRIVSVSLLEKPLYWPGWYILKLPEAKDDLPYIQLFHSLGIRDLLSSSTATVAWMAIPDIETIKVSEIDTILPLGDPRRDPFLQRVGKLFRSGNSLLIYLPANRSLADYRHLLSTHPLLSDLTLIDDVQGRHTVFMLVFILLLAILALLLPGGTFVNFLAFLPWAMAVIFLGRHSAFLGLMLYTLASFCQGSGKWIRLTSMGIIPIVFVIMFFLLPVHQFLILLTAGLETGVFLFLFQKLFASSLLEGKQEHTLFEPLRLLGSDQNHTVHKNSIIRIIAAALMPFALFAIPQTTLNNEYFPSVQSSTGTYNSISALYNLFSRENADSLPNVSGLVASLAFQTDFLNNAKFGLPLPGDTLTQRIYRKSDNRIQVEEIAVTTYNTDWYNKTIESALSDGTGLLFSTLDGPAPIVLSPLKGVHGIKLPTELIISLFVILLSGLIFTRPHSNEHAVLQRKQRKARVA